MERLQEWLEDSNILTPLQAGFRTKTSTIDQAFRFAILYWKYVSLEKQNLYVAFIDLRAASELVPRETLWYVLREMDAPEN